MLIIFIQTFFIALWLFISIGILTIGMFSDCDGGVWILVGVLSLCLWVATICTFCTPHSAY